MSKGMITMIFLMFLVLTELIRIPCRIQNYTNRMQKNIKDDRISQIEVRLMTISFMGMWIMPIIFSLTHWLDAADYMMPEWLTWIGLIMLVLSVVIHTKAHIDLGWNWSPSLEIIKGHRLITHGIYAYIRHPIYAATFLQVIAQIILLPNWAAGLAGIITFIPIYIIRIPIEEQMMLDTFKEEYKIYTFKTPKIIPRSDDMSMQG